jgi:hypothetical protein
MDLLKKVYEDAENYIIRSLIIYTLCPILLGRLNQEG